MKMLKKKCKKITDTDSRKSTTHRKSVCRKSFKFMTNDGKNKLNKRSYTKLWLLRLCRRNAEKWRKISNAKEF